MSDFYRAEQPMSDREQRIEQNKERVRIEGNTIIIAEGQSAFDNGNDTYLLGPLENSKIDVFRTLKDDSGYELKSEGFFACAEVTGTNDQHQQFLIHALDHLRLREHFVKILELPKAESPSHVTIRLDPDRADKQSYQRMAKEIFPPETEVEFKTFLDP